MTGPLAGLHVVEIADEISGPYAAKLFVDLGAEVTKVEPPAGDTLPRWGPFPMDEWTRSAAGRSNTSTPANAVPPPGHRRAAAQHLNSLVAGPIR